MTRLAPEVLEVVSPGLGLSLQDLGRPGWRRFGVPPGGAMDDHAAMFANRLLDNPPSASVLECMLQGVRLRVLRDTWVAMTGADAESNLPMWRAVALSAGEEICMRRHRLGVWTYLAVEHGFVDGDPDRVGQSWMTGRLHRPLRKGDHLRQREAAHFRMPDHVANRMASPGEIWNYAEPPVLRIWPGPQWSAFSDEERHRFLSEPWTVTPQSNRVGYRLEGPALHAKRAQILSEPVRVGTIQVPDGGQPIVTMRDGPTVGGYPKLAVMEPKDLAWLAQASPGQEVRFGLVT